LKQERAYAAQQETAPVARKEAAPRAGKSAEAGRRRIFPEHPERRDEIIEPEEIPADSERIGEEVPELLEYKPGELYIRRPIRPEHALPDGEGVVTGPLPSPPLPRTNAGPSLLARSLAGKYRDRLPLHRRIGIFTRAGVRLKASTVSDRVQGAAEPLEPSYDCLRKRVLGCDCIQVDETTIPVSDKDKPGAARKGYHWVVRSPELKSLFFHYGKGFRAQYAAVESLKDFRGAVQSDGYGACDICENEQGVLLLGCRAHVRRRFGHALSDDPGRARYALRVIGELYAIERRVKEQGLPPEEIRSVREKEARPLMKESEKRIEREAKATTPQSSIGKALRYALYPRMARYVMDGRYRIGNNGAENAVRPLALGRKNYPFCRNRETAVPYGRRILPAGNLPPGGDRAHTMACGCIITHSGLLRKTARRTRRTNGNRRIEMIFQADTKPEYKNQGGATASPSCNESRRSSPLGAGFSLTGGTASPAYTALYGGGIHNKQD